MSWISDVSEEVGRLKRNSREVKRFGFLVGAVFVFLGGAGYLKHWSVYVISLLGSLGLFLLVVGWLYPPALKRIYGLWMGVAFAIGWIMSRLILILMFYLVITPIGIVARLSGKKFIEVEFRGGRDSYWIPRDKSKSINYDKMV